MIQKIFLCSLLFFACGNTSNNSSTDIQTSNKQAQNTEKTTPPSSNTNATTETKPTKTTPTNTTNSTNATGSKKTHTNTSNQYTWLENYDINAALINRIPVPKGYKRIEVEAHSFGDWLRYLPLKPRDADVYLYNGMAKPRQDVHAAVVNIDVGNRDLQQCADAVMRLKAEYHYSRGEFDDIHFNFTSGDRVSFDDWRFGRKPKISGNKVTFSSKTGTANNSYKNFKSYMNMIFNYAGTYSLDRELKSTPIENIQIGDVFIYGAFPGHAMMVMDVAKNKAGKTIFLLSQSYMPAQSIHIVNNFNAESETLGCWFSTDFGSNLSTPEYDFQRSALKKW